MRRLLADVFFDRRLRRCDGSVNEVTDDAAPELSLRTADGSYPANKGPRLTVCQGRGKKNLCIE